MAKLKCWKRIHKYGTKDTEGHKSISDAWKSGSDSDFEFSSLVDVRDESKHPDMKGIVRLSIYPAKGGKKESTFSSRKAALKKAEDYMKKHDTCKL
jgi:hypothetical protein